jgi:prepilin-type N-terminal cleavage/methylation domain-containing protein
MTRFMEIRPNKQHNQQGFTLLELMISTAILGIIISVAMPNFSDIGDSQRLIGATEQLYNHIQQARSESVTGNVAGFVNFNATGTSTWQYGISTANTLCTLTAVLPTTANACVIVVDDGDGTVDPGDGSVDTGDLILMRYDNVEWVDVEMNIAAFSSTNTQLVFNPVRGTSTSGVINLESGMGRQLQINVSLLGRPSICIPTSSLTVTVGNYRGC